MMRNQTWTIALLIGLMCVFRLSMSAFGYINPHGFMDEIGLALESNPQMPYVIRVWAIRDVVLAVLVAFANQSTVKTLLISCAVIDLTDIVSAYLSGNSEGWLLKVTATAIAALLLELVAIVLLPVQKSSQLVEGE